MTRFTKPAVLAVVLTLVATSAQASIVRAAAGTIADATAARDAFRFDIGGGDTPGAGGLFGGVRREINWDGAPDAVSDPNFMPATQFLARGVLFGTNGEGLMMSAKADNPTATPPLYARFSAAYANEFAAFSPERVFTAIGSNRLDVTFTVPGSTTPGLTTGFGAIFADVDLPFTTSIEYFTLDGSSLGKFFVPALEGSETFSFLGVTFDAPLVHRVEIVLGTIGPGFYGEPAGHDVVVVDDMLYGEPIAAPPGCQGDAFTLCLNEGRFQLRVEFATAAGGARNLGRVQRLAADSGALWFFSGNNFEMLVKVLDACALNDRFWVFAAAATHVELEIQVIDTRANQTKTYFKPFGPPAPAITDTNALATCGF
jgi:hypothetical protein